MNPVQQATATLPAAEQVHAHAMVAGGAPTAVVVRPPMQRSDPRIADADPVVTEPALLFATVLDDLPFPDRLAWTPHTHPPAASLNQRSFTWDRDLGRNRRRENLHGVTAVSARRRDLRNAGPVEVTR